MQNNSSWNAYGIPFIELVKFHWLSLQFNTLVKCPLILTAVHLFRKEYNLSPFDYDHNKVSTPSFIQLQSLDSKMVTIRKNPSVLGFNLPLWHFYFQIKLSQSIISNRKLGFSNSLSLSLHTIQHNYKLLHTSKLFNSSLKIFIAPYHNS